MRFNRSSRSVILGSVATCLFVLGGCDPVPSKVLTQVQKEADMKWLYSQFDENYAPLEYKEKLYGFDYQVLKENYLGQALATTTNDEFYLVMHRFVAEFKDAHTTASLNHGGLPNRAKIAYLGFSGKRVGEYFVVTEILPTYDSKKSKFPIHKGDVISRLDGKPLAAIINEDQVQYENLGHSAANQTFHMNRIFNRVSTASALPTQENATLEIIARNYTAEERDSVGQEEGRLVGEHEKRAVSMVVTVPWVVKDIHEFKRKQKEATGEKGATSEKGATGETGAKGATSTEAEDRFLIEHGAGDLSLFLGLRGFDGALKYPLAILEKSLRGGAFKFLETFYFPNQLESWTTAVGATEDAESTLAQLKSNRVVPKGARFITEPGATFPAYITEEIIRTLDGGPTERKKLVATIYLNTFSPEGKDATREKVMKEFQKTLEDLQFFGVEDLILDTINNGGGSLALGMDLAQALTNRKIEMPSMQFRLSETWLDEFETLSLTAPSDTEKELARRVFTQLKDEDGKGQRLSSPISAESLIPFELAPNTRLKRNFRIVVLVNEMCASMCDIFAGIIQDNRLGYILGSQTMGAGGNVVAHYQAPNSHLVIRQTESLIVRSNQSRSYIENAGIFPDVLMDVNLDTEEKYKNVHQAAVMVLTLQDSKPVKAKRRVSH